MISDMNNKIINLEDQKKFKDCTSSKPQITVDQFIDKYIPPKPTGFKSIDFLNGVLTPDDVDQ